MMLDNDEDIQFDECGILQIGPQLKSTTADSSTVDIFLPVK